MCVRPNPKMVGARLCMTRFIKENLHDSLKEHGTVSLWRGGAKQPPAGRVFVRLNVAETLEAARLWLPALFQGNYLHMAIFQVWGRNINVL